jgi:hypothetical protein
MSAQMSLELDFGTWVARWYFFKPKIPILSKFWTACLRQFMFKELG